MDATTIAVFISIFSGILSAILLSFLPLILSGERWKAAEEKAHARRVADARMNARLLRFNL
jgi:predicted cobalt transporter CbtA